MPFPLFKETFFSECSETMYLISLPQNLQSDNFKLIVNKDYPYLIICQAFKGPSVLNVNYQSGFKLNST